MVFSSTVFLFLFLPLVLIFYFNPWKRTLRFRNRVLLFASLFFYAWGEPLFVLLMLLSIAVCWRAGRLLETSAHKKRVLWLAVSYNVLLLFVFKYLTFAAREAGLLFGWESTISIALPIGISFFTFQILSYLFDVYRGKIPAQRKLSAVALYISLFPALIAGPIVRYETIAADIEGRVHTAADFTEGMLRFIYGLAKKVLLADYLAQIADGIFAHTGGGQTEPIAMATAWLGAIAYTLQIYFDFSGYSDMAIGLSRMFGFHFPENFRYPYAASSVTDFWRRWHISLSSWFRDYVYIPMGGKRVSRGRRVWNLFVVWALTGLWHGANWTFLAWGMFYFVLLLFEKWTGAAERLGPFSRVYTLVAVVMAWAMFRAPDVVAGLAYWGAMWGVGAAGLTDADFFFYWENGKIILLAAALLSLPVYEKLSEKFSAGRLWKNAAEPALALCLFLLSLIGAVASTYHPFIYFNF